MYTSCRTSRRQRASFLTNPASSRRTRTPMLYLVCKRPKNEGAGAAVVTATRIKADGTVNWHTVLSKQGQGADIAVSPKHDYIVVGGLGTSTDVGMVGSGGTQVNAHARPDAARGTLLWSAAALRVSAHTSKANLQQGLPSHGA